MKLVFINPLVDRHKIYGRFHKIGGLMPPLGLAYVAAMLEKHGHAVSILDANVLQLEPQAAAAEALKSRPDMVGITATTASYYAGREVAQSLKALSPQTPVCIGGPHVLGSELTVLNDDPCWDYIVSGEGELTSLELVRALESGGDLSQVLGLSFRKGDQPVVNPERALIEDLDELPFPARHLLPPMERYRPKAVDYRRLPATQMLTSRGCPYRCIFCRTSFGKQTRFHSPEYVVAEIESLMRDFGVREVKINDDTFIVSRQRVMRICELIIAKKLDIVWSCNVRANLVDRELLLAMKQAGCWGVAVGLESASDEILVALKKGATVEQGINACNLAYELGFSVRPSFIIGSPLETEETIEATIRLACSLPVHFPSFTLMTPFPGTEMWETANQYGAFDGSDFSRLLVGSKASFVPKGLTADYLELKCREAYRRAYLNPGMILRHLRRVRSFRDLKLLVDGFIGLVSK